MAVDHSSEIILDRETLSDTYTPPFITARQRHINELQRCISPTLEGQKPLAAWLHGGPGTAKTTVASHVLSEFSKKASLMSVHVNCWKYNTFYSVLEFILNELRRGFGDIRVTSVKLEQLARLLKDRPFLIVLDEIDLLHPRERSDLIYNLLSIGNVGLICISESRYPILTLDPRVRSRLNPQLIGFESYSFQEMVEILKQRASLSLHPDSWDSNTLKRIAIKARGDARIAINTLRNAALHADSERAKKIKPAHIEKGYTDTGGIRRTYELKKLTEHHMLLYRLIKERPGILSPTLFQAYLQECEKKNWKPIASRTFSLYMQKMAGLKLIHVKRARVKGRVYSFAADNREPRTRNG